MEITPYKPTEPKLTILITGSRDLSGFENPLNTARQLLSHPAALIGPENIRVIHGDAQGWDSVFDAVVRAWGGGMKVLSFPAQYFSTPLVRNELMVKEAQLHRDTLHRDVLCWAFASKWASGTGHCARLARKASIRTIDYGVNTQIGARP